MASTTYLEDFLRAIPGIHPYTLGANPRAVEGPLVHIAVGSRSERVGTNVETVRRRGVRCWELPTSAADSAEFA